MSAVEVIFLIHVRGYFCSVQNQVQNQAKQLLMAAVSSGWACGGRGLMGLTCRTPAAICRTPAAFVEHLKHLRDTRSTCRKPGTLLQHHKPRIAAAVPGMGHDPELMGPGPTDPGPGHMSPQTISRKRWTASFLPQAPFSVILAFKRIQRRKYGKNQMLSLFGFFFLLFMFLVRF